MSSVRRTNFTSYQHVANYAFAGASKTINWISVVLRPTRDIITSFREMTCYRSVSSNTIRTIWGILLRLHSVTISGAVIYRLYTCIVLLAAAACWEVLNRFQRSFGRHIDRICLNTGVGSLLPLSDKRNGIRECSILNLQICAWPYPLCKLRRLSDWRLVVSRHTCMPDAPDMLVSVRVSLANLRVCPC